MLTIGELIARPSMQPIVENPRGIPYAPAHHDAFPHQKHREALAPYRAPAFFYRQQRVRNNRPNGETGDDAG